MVTFDPKQLSDDDLLERLHSMTVKSNEVEADLIEHLGEVDARRLYLGRAHPSLFSFCVGELGFSESVALNRIQVARTSRRFPVMLTLLRAGQVHTSGLRVLAPFLTEENSEGLLAEAVGKTKRQIEELLARHFPKAPVADVIRKVPERQAPTTSPAPSPEQSVALSESEPSQAAPHTLGPFSLRPPPRPAVEPLSAEHFKIQFTADVGLRDKLREAQDLLRHQVPDGSLAAHPVGWGAAPSSTAPSRSCFMR
jgi:hypothetical protein